MLVIGKSTTVNTCDCCGKTDLRYTIRVACNDSVMHFGCICAPAILQMSRRECEATANAAEFLRTPVGSSYPVEQVQIKFSFRRSAKIGDYFFPNLRHLAAA